ncbi:MAG: energy transducer TonB, partial [Bacteroidales bacterium]|nr:energy transducer TonB [Bacteroidales bacterium]
VNNDGSISDVVVVKGLCESIDKEAIKVVSVSPKWIPGEINRKKIRCKITLPIEFKLRK